MQGFARQAREARQKGQHLVRKCRFFSKSKDERLSAGRKLLGMVKSVKVKLGKALLDSKKGASRLKKYGKVARQKLELLYQSADRLIPQIRYWLDTGWVAKKKLVNILMPEICSIPRGKVGKDVEFGLKWGIARYGGGFLHGVAGSERGNFSDKKHVIEAVEDSKRLFGQVPTMLTYDRGGYSTGNVKELETLGVKEPGLAPIGSAPWPIGKKAQRKARRERVKVEGAIGALKSGHYTFNRPLVRSTEMMLACGHRSVLGYNLNRLLDGIARRDGIALPGA